MNNTFVDKNINFLRISFLNKDDFWCKVRIFHNEKTKLLYYQRYMSKSIILKMIMNNLEKTDK